MSKDSSKDIVYYYSKVFVFLKWISVFQLVKYIYVKWGKKDSDYLAGLTEIWVFAHLMLSFVSIIIAYYFGDIKWLIIILMGYGCVRVFEIIITQINILLFDQYRAERAMKAKHTESKESVKSIYQIKGFRRIIILLIHNVFEITFWFTVAYLYLLELFKIDDSINNNIAQALYISFVTMTSFGNPNYTITDSLLLYVISAQSFIGIVMTLFTLARFISLLPNINSKDEH